MASLGVLGALSLLRFWVDSRIGLGDSEAYYAAWALTPQWSYFDHPPLTAWMISLSISRPRAPFILLFILTGMLTHLLAERISGRPRAGFFAVAWMLAIPAFVVGGFAAAPEGPLAFFWLLALLAGLRFAERGHAGWIALAGAAMGAGFLAKYTAVLLAPLLAALIFRNAAAGRRRLLLALLLLSAAPFAAPVLIWNLQNGWASVRYHVLERQGGFGLSPLNPVKFAGGQAAYYGAGIFLLLAWWRSPAIRHESTAPEPLETAGARRFWSGAVKLPLIFFAVLGLLMPRAEPHWTAVAWLPLCAWAGTGSDLPGLREWARAGLRRAALIAAALTVLLLVPLLHLHVLTAWGARLPPAAAYQPKWDIANELRGWDSVIAMVPDAARLSARAGKPMLAGSYHYAICGQLAWGLRGDMNVVCPNNRRDAFDWLPAPDPLGADILFVNDLRYTARAEEVWRCGAFEPAGEWTLRDNGVLLRRFGLTICRDFQGVSAASRH
ncbi:MAG: hypothetical protein GMKNLPBB_02302 [Myxococcota bacterium]|nr:hypothetical protein [Myxococcota bacterium]